MVAFPDPKSRHPFHMHAMIRGQPSFLEETLRRVDQSDVGSFLGRPRRLIVTGCGTSFHAAMYGARVLQEALPAVPVAAIHAYDLASGGFAPAKGTILGVSHSGSTPTTNRALVRVGRRGCRTIGICGLPGTPMEEYVERTLVIGSTHDRSWANTMSFTTQLAAFASIAERAGEPQGNAFRRAIHALPRTVQRALGCERIVRRLAGPIARRSRVTFLGSGLDEVAALEAALKIRETCGLPASGYHLEQFLHGPYLSIDRDESIVMLRSREDGERSAVIERALRAAGASVTTLGEPAGVKVVLPTIHRTLRPIVSIVSLQFLAYYAALARHANPDIMRTDIPRLQPGVEALFH